MHRLNVSIFVVLGGHTGVVCGANAIGPALDTAREYVALFLGNDPARMVCRVEIAETCKACAGQGWTQRTSRCKRRKCRACDLGEARKLVDVYVHRTDVDPANTRVLALDAA